MRTIGVIFWITALAAFVFSPLPAAAFGIHLGPLHFGVGHHHHHHHLHMRTNPRLDAAEQRLDATMQAIHILRSPLERFYRSLSDEQMRQFNAINGSTEGARSNGNPATLCSQQAGAVIDLPVQRIEQVVQPTAQQQSTFDELKKAAQKAGDQLQSSCPTEVPKWPVARLDTVATRLSNMVNAIEAVRPNLKNFYASLSDEQKERFNLMGTPPKSAPSPSEH